METPTKAPGNKKFMTQAEAKVSEGTTDSKTEKSAIKACWDFCKKAKSAISKNRKFQMALRVFAVALVGTNVRAYAPVDR